MTDAGRSRGTAGPWSVDQLADLHAGALDENEAADLWRRVQGDPDAMAVLAALDATTTDLAGLSDEPVEPMPADVAARIDSALAEEAAHQPQGDAQSGQQAPVIDMAAARRKRNQRLGWGAGLLTAAAAVVAAVAIVVPNQSTPGAPIAEPTQQEGEAGTSPGQEPLSLSEDGVPDALGDTIGSKSYGAMGNEEGLKKCLKAADIDGEDAIGARPVTIDGESAVLVVLTTGEFAQYRMVAVPDDCGPGNNELIYDKVVGRK